jgi:tRNA modification GTPase
MLPPSPTHVIELTPVGRGAVAVVLVAGPKAAAVVDECLIRKPGKRLGDALGHILVGHWGTAGGEEVVVCRRSEDAVEVHCHGGVAAVRAVIGRLCELGCQSLRWQDWIVATAGDPIRADAQFALANAPTARTAAILLDQYDGALTLSIRAVITAAVANDWDTAIAMLEAMLSRRGVGLHLTQPWRVVLAGRPNVGKSSLMNALVGFQRAIVCDLPGTTRDVVTATTAIDGWPVQLADTAGIRAATDEIESAGVTRATDAAADADLVVLVSDVENDAGIEPPGGVPVLRVLNKIDLPNNARATSSVCNEYDVRTSVVTGEGIAELVNAIGSALVPIAPAVGAAVPFTPEQIERLEAALSAVRRGDAGDVSTCLQPLLGP